MEYEAGPKMAGEDEDEDELSVERYLNPPPAEIQDEAAGVLHLVQGWEQRGRPELVSVIFCFRRHI